MDKKLHQQHGTNWRECVIEDDRLVLTTHIDGQERQTVMPYDLGLVSADVDEVEAAERIGNSKLAGLWVGLSVLAMIGSFPLLGSKKQGLIGLGIVLGIGSLIGFYLALSKSQPQKVEMLRIYIGNGSFMCYGRNAKDKDQVQALLAGIAQSQRAYFRSKFLARNDAMTTEEIKKRLSWLYEHHFIDDNELAAELKKLPPQHK